MSISEQTREAVGAVFHVQRFSLDDGPGIRTTLFLKGCSYACVWCHNPESIHSKVEMMTYPDRCTDCGMCIPVCPLGIRRRLNGTIVFDRDQCIGCGACEQACLHRAVLKCGEAMTAERAVRLLARDSAFYRRSGGGVTFSGGEPMMQHAFVANVAREMKQMGIHTALDTAGNVPSEWYDESILSNIDLFLYDVKCVDPAKHIRATGASNERSIQNLRLLSARGARLWIRLPFIPGLTCDSEEIGRISDLLRPLRGIERVELVPYHSYGESKYPALGRKYQCATHGPDRTEIGEVLSAFARRGLAVQCEQAGARSYSH